MIREGTGERACEKLHAGERLRAIVFAPGATAAGRASGAAPESSARQDLRAAAAQEGAREQSKTGQAKGRRFGHASERDIVNGADVIRTGSREDVEEAEELPLRHWSVRAC